MSFNYLGFEEGLITFKYKNEKIINPFEIALQAMLGESVSLAYNNNSLNLIPRYVNLDLIDNCENDFYSKKAIDWLKNNVIIEADCFFWDYNYNIIYNGENIDAPWRSSFAQAYIILAFVYWYKLTKDDEYLKYALGAYNGLKKDYKENGVLFKDGDFFWFEEIPNKNITHILNANLISIVAMIELQKHYYSNELDDIIKIAITSLENTIDKYDSGNSSNYEINKNINTVLLLKPSDIKNKIKIRKISVLEKDVVRKIIDVNESNAFNIQEDIYLSGIDWGFVDENGFRNIESGYLLRSEAVEGGERQNTYLCFNNFKMNTDNISLEIEYSSDGNNLIELYKQNNLDGKFNKLMFQKFDINKQNNKSEIVLNCKHLQSDLNKIYQEYHIQLLDEIIDYCNSGILKNKVNNFREYLKEYKLYESRKRKLEYIFVSVNNECGLSCKMCDVGMKNYEASIYKNLVKNNSKERFPLDVFLKRCRELGDDLNTVHLIGTEPTLYKELYTLIKEIKKMGKRLVLTTNGIVIDKILKDIINLDVDELWISIDGPEAIHDYIRGKIGLFNGIYRTLLSNKNLIEEKNEKGKFKINISCAITPLNYKSLSEMIDSLEKLPIETISFTHMNFVTNKIADNHNYCSKYKIGKSCINEEVDPLNINPYLLYKEIKRINNIDNKKNKISFSPNIDNFLDIKYFYHKPNINVCRDECKVMDNCLEINSDGSVCIMARCYNLDLGNIQTQSLKDIFYSDNMYEFIGELEKNGLYEACYRCCGIM